MDSASLIISWRREDIPGPEIKRVQPLCTASISALFIPKSFLRGDFLYELVPFAIVTYAFPQCQIEIGLGKQQESYPQVIRLFRLWRMSPDAPFLRSLFSH
jgi:hypothetical protein